MTEEKLVVVVDPNGLRMPETPLECTESVLRLQEALRERDEAIKQQRLAWDRHAEKDRAYGEALRERDEAKAEVERLRERLQFDPGGSDKVDELEDAMKYLRAEVKREKASATRGWQTADELHLTVRDLKAEIERLRATDEVQKQTILALTGNKP